jgi:hypothetical protein
MIMYRYLIDTLPIWGLITLTIAILILVTLMSAKLFSWCPKSNDTNYEKISTTLITIISGGFSILLAFVIINTWDYYLKSTDIVSREASYLATMLRDSKAFPREFQEKLHSAIAEYTVAVRFYEWDDMGKGRENAQAWDAINNIYKLMTAYEPKPGKEGLFYNQLIIQMNNLLDTRRERLNSSNSVIPGTLRNALIISSIFLMAVLGAIQGRADVLNLLPVLFFAGIIGFNLALALSFDYPYSGDISISNKPFYRGALGKIPDPA